MGLKNIHKIAVTRSFEGGAVRAITATASNGRTKTISGKADYMRSRFGLMSPWVTSIDERY